LKVHVVGAGLAGSEVAYQLAIRGIEVILHEMRPAKMTPVHRTGFFAELVCSNSLKSEELRNASGLLKSEMELFGSLTLKIARECRVPAGKALAVDREKFSMRVTEEVLKSGVQLIVEEVSEIPDDGNVWVIATGPATCEPLMNWLSEKLGKALYFFDAVAPIIAADSIDYSKVFFADRYGTGTSDYINCPMNEEQYERFYEALVSAEVVPVEDFDSCLLFERCKPIEEIARSGKMSLLFGPLRPVGLIDPRTNRQPYAVVQLRKENVEGTMYNIVGFQTRLKWPEQKRVIRLIPGLENAEILRYGVMHRNFYVNSRKVLDCHFRLKGTEKVFFAGQITGVEGYMESAASGLYVALNIYRYLKGQSLLRLPSTTMMGSLFEYVCNGITDQLQPMYANYGLLKDSKNRTKAAERSLRDLEKFLAESGWREG